MRVLDLFSGIGGFSLGLERAGMKTIAFCEVEEYPRSILKKHWPDVPIAGDIRKLSYKKKTKELIYDGAVIYVGPIELVCGGVPCQPFSVAGKQRGKEDNRHLWPEMLRLIKEIEPDWVIVENVVGFIKLALDDVSLNLEEQGFTSRPFVIPACAVGGIHRRDRVWIIANADKLADGQQHQHATRPQPDNDEREIRGICSNTKHNGRHTTAQQRSDGSILQAGAQRTNEAMQSSRVCPAAHVADTKRAGLERYTGNEQDTREGAKQGGSITATGFSRNWKPIGYPVEPAVCHRNDGLPDRVARLKALGNAVVPQIPEMIGRAIMAVSDA